MNYRCQTTNIKISTAASYTVKGHNSQLGTDSKTWSKSFEDPATTDSAYLSE